MPSNERENKRKEIQKNKDKRIKNTVYIVLIIILAVLLIMKACEINVSTVKESVKINSVISDNFPYEINSLQGADLNYINNKIVVTSNNGVTVLNPGNANCDYEYNLGYASPVFNYNGQYILAYDQGGTRFRVDTVSKNIYEKTVDKSIICADVSNNGSVVYATLDDNVKAVIYILNSSENNKMTLDVSDGYVTAVALSKSGDKCAYATVNSKNATFVTTIHSIDVKSKKEGKTFELKDVNVLDLHFTSSTDFYVIGDNSLSMVKSQRKNVDIIKQGEGSIKQFDYTSNDELVLNYSHFENDTNSEIAYINSSGKIKNSYTLKEEVKDFSVKDNEITVLFPNKINVYALNRDNLKDTVSCSNSVRKAIALSSKYYVLTGNSIDKIN